MTNESMHILREHKGNGPFAHDSSVAVAPLSSLRSERITQHIRFGFALPFGTLLPSVATSYMLGTLGDIASHPKRGGENDIENLGMS
jgi:hypothetical protein